MALHLHARRESFDALGKQLNRVIDEIAQRNYYQFSRSSAWQPAVNLYENDTSYQLCVELAGLSRDQITVEVVDRRITIRGRRPVPPPPGETQPKCILRIEVDSGPFERTIELPSSADMDSTRAELKDGFLWLTIEKQ